MSEYTFETVPGLVGRIAELMESIDQLVKEPTVVAIGIRADYVAKNDATVPPPQRSSSATITSTPAPTDALCRGYFIIQIEGGNIPPL